MCSALPSAAHVGGRVESGSSARDDGPVLGRVPEPAVLPPHLEHADPVQGTVSAVGHPELHETHGTFKLLFDALVGRGSERPRA